MVGTDKELVLKAWERETADHSGVAGALSSRHSHQMKSLRSLLHHG